MESEAQEILFSRIQIVNLQTKGEQNDQMIRMLQKGARDQLLFYINEHRQDDLLSEEEKEFLDI